MVTDQPAKGQSDVTIWYFSRNASSAIQRLTIDNLVQDFPDNHVFHDAMKAEFKTDVELSEYDTAHKMMRINRLYLNSQQK